MGVHPHPRSVLGRICCLWLDTGPPEMGLRIALAFGGVSALLGWAMVTALFAELRPLFALCLFSSIRLQKPSSGRLVKFEGFRNKDALAPLPAHEN